MLSGRLNGLMTWFIYELVGVTAGVNSSLVRVLTDSFLAVFLGRMRVVLGARFMILLVRVLVRNIM